MISEFHDLSDKINQLAALTTSLRTENYLLRQANTILGAENLAFQNRLAEAQRRVEALLAQLPPVAQPEAAEPAPTTTAEAPQ
jgi:regulator of replication initiation timing